MFFARARKPDFQAQKLPNGLGAYEAPKKEWVTRPGEGDALAVLSPRRGEAQVVFERTQLNQPLAVDDITDLFAELERDHQQERNPKATAFDVHLFRLGTGLRVAVVQFTRSGARGAERVRVYAYPVGRDLFRLICSAPADRFATYEPVFAHVAVSFEPRASS